MKTLTTLALAAALASGAFSLQAADLDDRAMSICAAQLQEHFGDDAQLTLVKKRQHVSGIRMTVAGRVDADNSKFATCWVGSEETAAVETPKQQDMLATTESADW